MEICKCPVTDCDYKPEEGGLCEYCKTNGCGEVVVER